jgi:hypothetical protein
VDLNRRSGDQEASFSLGSGRGLGAVFATANPTEQNDNTRGNKPLNFKVESQAEGPTQKKRENQEKTSLLTS